MEEIGEDLNQTVIVVGNGGCRGKAHVKLYRTDGKLKHAVEVGVSNAKVVEVEGVATLGQLLHIGSCGGKLLNNNSLCKLKAQSLVGDAVSVNDLVQPLNKAVVHKVGDGEVNRCSDVAKLGMITKHLAHLIDNEACDRNDKSGSLGNGNELAGTDKASVRLTKTDKCLHGGEAFLSCTVNGLIPNLEAVGGINLLKSADEVLLTEHFHAHLGSVVEVVGIRLAHLMERIGQLLVEGCGVDVALTGTANNSVLKVNGVVFKAHRLAGILNEL